MTSSAEYTQIAHLVKGWADQIDANTIPLRIMNLSAIAQEMRAVSNGIVVAVNLFSTVMDAATPQDAEDAAIALVAKRNGKEIVADDKLLTDLGNALYGRCLHPNHPLACQYPAAPDETPEDN